MAKLRLRYFDIFVPMRRFSFTRLAIALFFTAVLGTTFFTQNIPLRKKCTSFYVDDCSWALQNPTNSDDDKKPVASSVNIIEEEEDKIVEEIDSLDIKLPGTIISVVYAYKPQLFEEPFLKVNDLPPWS